MANRLLDTHRFLIVALVVLVMAAPAAAADFGRPSGGGFEIEWVVNVSGHEQIQLTVIAPDGEAFVREFPAARNPSFRLSELEEVLDGQYAYEMRVTPKVPQHIKSALANARAAGDDRRARKIIRSAGLDQPMVQSGTFSVLNGTILDPDAVEPGIVGASSQTDAAGSASMSSTSTRPITPLDQVIPDDLIVQSSLCVGFDCVNNESFGFDTIRLKENNTRIKFEDTSTTAGYASNDWQLEANSSASGGANSFSLLDVTGAKTPLTILAGAPTSSLFVGSNGKLGGRTATPVLDLHLTTGDTPAIRLEQTNASGYTAQTWDVAGNEANFFVRDVTGGSKLPFRIRPGAPTSSIDIKATGDVGIGTASPTSRLHVAGTSSILTIQDTASAKSSVAVAGFFRFTDINGEVYGYFGDTTSGSNNMSVYAGATHGLTLSAGGALILFAPATGNIGLGGQTAPAHPLHHLNGAHLTTGGVWTNASSREFKQDISALESDEARETLDGLNPVTFAYKSDPTDEYVGFIAEDVPELVATPDRQGLSPMDVVAVLTKVVKDQQKTIDKLSARLAELEKNAQH